MSTTTEKLDAVRDAQVDAVNSKGGTLAANATLWEIRAAINQLPDVSDTTAAAGDVRSGKYFYSSSGVKTTGTLVPLDTSDATAEAGNIDSGKTAYVNGVKLTGTSTKKDVSDTTAVASNVASGKYFYSSSGVRTAGTAIIGPFYLYKITSTSPLQGQRATNYASGVWSFNSTAESLTAGSVTPVLYGIYAAKGTALVGSLIDVDLSSGLLFYAPLHSAQSYASTGQRLTGVGTVTYEEVGGLAAFSNDGGSNCVSFPDTGFPSGSSDRTISCMFRANVISTDAPRIFSYGTSAANKAVVFNAGWNSAFGVEYYGDEIRSHALAANNWYHAAMKLESGTTTIFINGSQAGSPGDLTVNTVLAGTGYVGRLGTEYFDGAVCELKVWNRALSTVEIAAESTRCLGLLG